MTNIPADGLGGLPATGGQLFFTGSEFRRTARLEVELVYDQIRYI